MSAPTSGRVRVRRLPDRGRYDTQIIHDILDEGFVCHLGFVVDGQPYVIPTLYGRDGDTLLVHGSSASRALRTGAALPVCVTVTHLDGLVLARALFHHSANYRSVVVLGQAVAVTDPAEKEAALRTITEHVVPGRWEEARSPNPKELAATGVLRLDLAECSAKIRSGPPGDDGQDLGLDVWAGVIPVAMTAGRPAAAPDLVQGVAISPAVAGWRPDQQRWRRGS